MPSANKKESSFKLERETSPDSKLGETSDTSKNKSKEKTGIKDYLKKGGMILLSGFLLGLGPIGIMLGIILFVAAFKEPIEKVLKKLVKTRKKSNSKSQYSAVSKQSETATNTLSENQNLASATKKGRLNKLNTGPETLSKANVISDDLKSVETIKENERFNALTTPSLELSEKAKNKVKKEKDRHLLKSQSLVNASKPKINIAQIKNSVT